MNTYAAALIEEFANCVAMQAQWMAQGDATRGNVFAKRYVDAFDQLRQLGDHGREALAVLLDDARIEVRVMAAAYLLRHSGNRARAVLEAASRTSGLVGFGAQQALARWEDGTWALDPA